MNRFQTWYRTQPRALRAILTINVAIYLAWVLVLGHIPAVFAFVRAHLALNPSLPGILFEPWQLVTYNFLHLGTDFGGLLHILFNMLWLVWIGREYEETHGAQRMLSVYVLAGVGGGLLTVLAANVLPGPSFDAWVHGASASVLGVMTLVATKYPHRSIALLFIGVVRLVWVVVAFLVLDLLFFRTSGTSVTAHLGGALAGFLIARAEMRGMDLSSWASVFFRDRRPARSARAAAPEGASMLGRMEAWLAGRGGARATTEKPAARIHPMPRVATAAQPDDEVDRILEKISADGYDALTDEEKRILYEASKR